MHSSLLQMGCRDLNHLDQKQQLDLTLIYLMNISETAWNILIMQ